MLAHTSLKQIMLTTQFVIGMVLLTASFLTHEHNPLAGESLKANTHAQPVIEAPVDQKRC